MNSNDKDQINHFLFHCIVLQYSFLPISVLHFNKKTLLLVGP